MYLQKTKTEVSKKQTIMESQTVNGRAKKNLWQPEIETELIKRTNRCFFSNPRNKKSKIEKKTN